MLPCEEEAKKLGFTVLCKSAISNSATYVNKNGIFLSIWEVNGDGFKHEATLEASVKMVNMKVGPFMFPHPNFNQFLGQITTMKGENLLHESM